MGRNQLINTNFTKLITRIPKPTDNEAKPAAESAFFYFASLAFLSRLRQFEILNHSDFVLRMGSFPSGFPSNFTENRSKMPVLLWITLDHFLAQFVTPSSVTFCWLIIHEALHQPVARE